MTKRICCDILRIFNFFIYLFILFINPHPEIGTQFHKKSTIWAVLTNGHTGHVPRAPGSFFLFEGPPTGCGEINFLKLIILLLMLLHDRTNTSSAYLVNLTVFVIK